MRTVVALGEAIKELVLKLIDLILGVMERSNGWKEVEQMR
jgi:hypothetical protein